MKDPDRPLPLGLPPRLAGLGRLARNLWWSWDVEARNLWDAIAARRPGPAAAGPLAPVRLLAALDAGRRAALARDAAFLKRLDGVIERFEKATAPPRRRFGGALGISPARPVAYFSMEYGLHASLPIYAGGLGILAGDHMKTASDMELPLLGIGLAYRQGYFRQEVDRRGRQRVVYPEARYGELPLEPARDRRGKELRIAVELPGERAGARPRRAVARVWIARAGRTPIYLLDVDFAANPPAIRRLGRKLYGGTREDRIFQEIIVGIGGVRLVRALGIEPSVWHLNEGHVVFSCIERLREILGIGGPARRGRAPDLDEAIERVAASTVFTTHTPVPEGNEVFDLALARRALEPLCPAPRLPIDAVLDLGLDQAPDGRPVLSMTVLAMRLSRLRNGVSKLHGEVSRRMWRHLWPELDENEVPIGSVTNGVHVGTWIAPEMDRLFRAGIDRRWPEKLGRPETWRAARRLSDEALWETRSILRGRMVAFVRERVRRQLEREGASAAAARRAAAGLLDPDAFTIGFARRFALYKRATLVFRDLVRARKLLARPDRRVQMVFAGKPHPEDAAGKALFESLIAIARRKDFRGRVVVLENYDMDVGAALVQGVDLWLNNPLRPQEASGTSGQKVPFNGGLNASVLDGWWAEGFDPAAGWAIGDTREHADRKEQDEADARSLLDTLECEIVPLFYDRDRKGLPRGWLARVKRSIETHVPEFSSRHMLERYVDELYLPAASGGARAAAANGKAAAEICAWSRRVELGWPAVHVRSVDSTGRGGALEVEVYLGSLEPADVRVTLAPIAGGRGGPPLAPAASVAAGPGLRRFRFRLRPKSARSARLRIWPCHDALPSAMESGRCLEVECEA